MGCLKKTLKIHVASLHGRGKENKQKQPKYVDFVMSIIYNKEITCLSNMKVSFQKRLGLHRY